LQPEFRIIALSQKLSREELDEKLMPLKILANGNIFQYSEGDDVTIITVNFSCQNGLKLTKLLKTSQIKATHFNIINIVNDDWDEVVNNIFRTKKIVIIDDSKSYQTCADQLLAKICGLEIQKKIVIKRELMED
jgi:pyruvate/2-oxoglutarate/acetoin dehydrogenase E1 component